MEINPVSRKTLEIKTLTSTKTLRIKIHIIWDPIKGVNPIGRSNPNKGNEPLKGNKPHKWNKHLKESFNDRINSYKEPPSVRGTLFDLKVYILSSNSDGSMSSSSSGASTSLSLSICRAINQ